MRFFFLGICVLALVRCGSEGPATPFAGDPNQSDFKQEVSTAKAGPAEGPFCKLGPAGKYEGTHGVIEKKGVDGEVFYALGGGCLYRPMREAWAVSHNPEAMKWGESDLKGVSIASDPRADFLFSANYEAGPFFYRQSWIIEWYQKLAKGSREVPEHVRIKFAKVTGTKHIEVWKGSIELQQLSDTVTSFAMRNDIKGTRIDEAKAAGGVNDIYSNFVKLDPDWTHLPKP